ncbi:MAG: phenylalanine--tRNA ligase subunit alpha [Alphaproteobacteria bacterium]
MSEIEPLEREILAAIAGADTEAALEDVRVGALGKKGSISDLLKTLGKMDDAERKEKGPQFNGLKTRVAEAIEARAKVLHDAALDARLETERVDVTLPAPVPQPGSIHPITQVSEEIMAIFADMGFAVAEGPDIEDDFHNFTALNFPEGHPARQMHDTFYLRARDGAAPDTKPNLLRTHTSPVQVRTMMAGPPPHRIIAPGRTYRCDSDQTHTPMFHQVEGLLIDRETHMGHLKWVLEEFCKAFFEVESVTMRARPSFFPFTEPSAEVDIRCDRSGGELKIGEGSDWLEILGCGMVHPNVLKAAGFDPAVYQGWAFGMGIDRLAMLKYGIPDLRDFFAADLRWLRHYGFTALDMPSLATGLSR